MRRPIWKRQFLRWSIAKDKLNYIELKYKASIMSFTYKELSLTHLQGSLRIPRRLKMCRFLSEPNPGSCCGRFIENRNVFLLPYSVYCYCSAHKHATNCVLFVLCGMRVGQSGLALMAGGVLLIWELPAAAGRQSPPARAPPGSARRFCRRPRWLMTASPKAVRANLPRPLQARRPGAPSFAAARRLPLPI